MCLGTCVRVGVADALGGQKEDIGFPGAGVTGSSGVSDVGTRNKTGVLCKSNTCSELLSHLSSISTFFFFSFETRT